MFFTETGDAMRISSGGVPFCSGVAGIGIGEGCLREEESSDDDIETRTGRLGISYSGASYRDMYSFAAEDLPRAKPAARPSS